MTLWLPQILPLRCRSKQCQVGWAKPHSSRSGRQDINKELNLGYQLLPNFLKPLSHKCCRDLYFKDLRLARPGVERQSTTCCFPIFPSSVGENEKRIFEGLWYIHLRRHGLQHSYCQTAKLGEIISPQRPGQVGQSWERRHQKPESFGHKEFACKIQVTLDLRSFRFRNGSPAWDWLEHGTQALNAPFLIAQDERPFSEVVQLYTVLILQEHWKRQKNPTLLMPTLAWAWHSSPWKG